MKLLKIDNPLGYLSDCNLVVAKGNKIIIIPADTKIISTGAYIPHIQKGSAVFKYCHKCKHWLSLNQFIKNNHSRDGLKDICRHCDNKRRRERYKLIKAVI